MNNILTEMDPSRARERPASAFLGRARLVLPTACVALACLAARAVPSIGDAAEVAAAEAPAQSAPATIGKLPPTEQAAPEEALPDRLYGRPQAVRPRGQSLDYRVKLLTSELNLDAGQQAQVRKALEDQRDQIKTLWANPAIPAGQRVNATKVIADKTAERIRGFLNKEQRDKYIAERKPAASGAGKPDVEHWMEATRPK